MVRPVSFALLPSGDDAYGERRCKWGGGEVLVVGVKEKCGRGEGGI